MVKWIAIAIGAAVALVAFVAGEPPALTNRSGLLLLGLALIVAATALIVAGVIPTPFR